MFDYSIHLQGQLQDVVSAASIDEARQEAQRRFGRVWGLSVEYLGPATVRVQVPTIVARYASASLSATEYADELVLRHRDGSMEVLAHLEGPLFGSDTVHACLTAQGLELGNGHVLRAC